MSVQADDAIASASKMSRVAKFITTGPGGKIIRSASKISMVLEPVFLVAGMMQDAITHMEMFQQGREIVNESFKHDSLTYKGMTVDKATGMLLRETGKTSQRDFILNQLDANELHLVGTAEAIADARESKEKNRDNVANSLASAFNELVHDRERLVQKLKPKNIQEAIGYLLLSKESYAKIEAAGNRVDDEVWFGETTDIAVMKDYLWSISKRLNPEIAQGNDLVVDWLNSTGGIASRDPATGRIIHNTSGTHFVSGRYSDAIIRMGGDLGTGKNLRDAGWMIQQGLTESQVIMNNIQDKWGNNPLFKQNGNMVGPQSSLLPNPSTMIPTAMLLERNASHQMGMFAMAGNQPPVIIDGSSANSNQYNTNVFNSDDYDGNFIDRDRDSLFTEVNYNMRA